MGSGYNCKFLFPELKDTDYHPYLTWGIRGGYYHLPTITDKQLLEAAMDKENVFFIIFTGEMMILKRFVNNIKISERNIPYKTKNTDKIHIGNIVKGLIPIKIKEQINKKVIYT